MKKLMKKKVSLFGKEFSVFALVAIMMVGLASAALVPYLSNVANGSVGVISPMTIQFAELDATTDYPVITSNPTWADSMTLVGTTGLSTSEVGVKVTNNADVKIENKILVLNLIDIANDVTCNDLSMLGFIDAGASLGTTEYQVMQNVTKYCWSPETGIAQWVIQINSLDVGQTYQYPAKMTFGNVAPSTYALDAELLNYDIAEYVTLNSIDITTWA